MRGLLLLSSLVQIERYLKSQIATTRQGVQTPVELRISIIFFFFMIHALCLSMVKCVIEVKRVKEGTVCVVF